MTTRPQDKREGSRPPSFGGTGVIIRPPPATTSARQYITGVPSLNETLNETAPAAPDRHAASGSGTFGVVALRLSFVVVTTVNVAWT
jgi:hypothetical protein